MEATVSYTPLTPLAFLGRAAEVFADKTAVVYGDRESSYQEFAAEVTRLAHALRASGIKAGDRVAYLCPNIPEMLVANFGVPLSGAILVPINTRLSAEEIAFICNDSGSRMLVTDTEYLPALAPVLSSLRSIETVVAIHDPEGPATPDSAGLADLSYPELLARGGVDPLPWTVADELAPISINYTSGTTGQPKGAVYVHRGAYLNALSEIIHQRFDPESVDLWTLPMFHCNGWCTPWAVTGAGATHVCLRAVRADTIWHLFDTERVTHLAGAPTVLVSIAGAEQAHCPERVATGMGRLGPAEQARRQARQGVAMIHSDPVRVVGKDMLDVPRDGQTIGEIVMRGNGVMAGYHNDEVATAAAFTGGWMHSGDLGVQHADGYVELRDRAKDIIISGGENISTVEVEHALESHPAVHEVAVVGVPDEKWGERPKAFVVLTSDAYGVTEADLIVHVRSHIARFKSPKSIEFVDTLPRTGSGKVQKFELREKEWAGHVSRIQG